MEVRNESFRLLSPGKTFKEQEQVPLSLDFDFETLPLFVPRPFNFTLTNNQSNSVNCKNIRDESESESRNNNNNKTSKKLRTSCQDISNYLEFPIDSTFLSLHFTCSQDQDQEELVEDKEQENYKTSSSWWLSTSNNYQGSPFSVTLCNSNNNNQLRL